MAIDKYTNAAVDVRGQRFLEAADISIERQSNAHEQNTLAKQLAGYSPGPAKMIVRITNAVLASGIEYDPGPDIAALNDVPFTIHAASSFLTSSGVIMSDKFDKGVDKNASLEMNITAKMAQWQRA